MATLMALPLLACSSSGPPPADAPASAPAEERSENVAPTASDSEPGLLPPSAPATPDTEATPKDARGKEEIQRVVADNRDKVRACYDAALKENPGIAGDLVVSFVIDPDGSVKSAEVNWAESELHVPELDTCAVAVVKALKFPASSRGLESKVNYPFNFNPAPPDRPKAAPSTPSSGAR
jgi:TonB family protein